MLLVQVSDHNNVELVYTWLPTWLGMNAEVLRWLEEDINARFTGKVLCEETLRDMHTAIIDKLEERFNIKGLRQYLEAVEQVTP